MEKRWLLPVLACLTLLCASVSYAAGPGVNVLVQGVYEVASVQKEATNTVVGSRNIVSGVKFLQITQTIPRRAGVRFGFQYEVTGQQESYTLVEKYIFPAAMTNPRTGKTSSSLERSKVVQRGGTTLMGYALEHDYELIPGTWTFQLIHEGSVLLERTFTVVGQ